MNPRNAFRMIGPRRRDAGCSRGPRWLISLAVPFALVLAGCVEIPIAEREEGPLEMTYLNMRQGRSRDVLDPTHLGTIHAERCVHNAGETPVPYRLGEDYYIVQPGADGETRELVAQYEYAGVVSRDWFVWTVGAKHKVTVDETADAGHVQYAANLWHEADYADGPVRTDLWVNFTFVPFTWQEIARDGERC